MANALLRPLLTFIYNYVLRGGFLDGREGLLLNLYRAACVSLKDAQSWSETRERDRVR